VATRGDPIVAVVRNVLTFDVEDWPQSTLDPSLPITARVTDNTLRLLDLLAAAGVQATFFILGLVAERFPDLVKRIVSARHEVATHGHAHGPVYSMSPEAFRTDLKRSIRLVEDAASCKVLGYRAPDFSISVKALWALEILAEEGLQYDSSIFPFVGPRYGIGAAFRVPCRVRCAMNPEFVEFPLATIECAGHRLPAAGGGYFRLLPYAYSRYAIKRLNRAGHPATAYFHPYEIDAEEIHRSPHPIPWSVRLSQGLGRSGVQKKLVRLLGDFSWGTAASWLADRRALTSGRVLDLTQPHLGAPRWSQEGIAS
jgi:polysaccharide deacetylase family protein (PEP-CTERM system associated)